MDRNNGLCSHNSRIQESVKHESKSVSSETECLQQCETRNDSICYYSWHEQKSECLIAYDITKICTETGWTTSNTKCSKPIEAGFNWVPLVAVLISLILAVTAILVAFFWAKKHRKLTYYLPEMSTMSTSRENLAEDFEQKTKHLIGDFDKLGPMKDEFSHLNHMDINRHVLYLTTDIGSEHNTLNR